MKICMQVDVSGTRNSRPWPRRGHEVEVPDHEGADLCAAGMAAPVADIAADVETATTVVDVEQRGPLTTETGPTPRKRGRPRKNVTE